VRWHAENRNRPRAQDRATRIGFGLPGDVSATKRYWTEDIITPPVEVSPLGTIIPLVAPGIASK
jgi:hypothetical protein